MSLAFEDEYASDDAHPDCGWRVPKMGSDQRFNWH